MNSYNGNELSMGIRPVFDNSAGRIGGQFASYNEIAVKRQVSLESQSTYFLNGARCRRRDVLDLFFGPLALLGQQRQLTFQVLPPRPEDGHLSRENLRRLR